VFKAHQLHDAVGCTFCHSRIRLSFPPRTFVQSEGRISRALYSHAPEYVSSIRGALLRGASHEHVGVMGVALCREGGNPRLRLRR